MSNNSFQAHVRTQVPIRKGKIVFLLRPGPRFKLSKAKNFSSIYYSIFKHNFDPITLNLRNYCHPHTLSNCVGLLVKSQQVKILKMINRMILYSRNSYSSITFIPHFLCYFTIDENMLDCLLYLVTHRARSTT